MKQIFPFVSALNWPSNVPHAWLALHQFGIQEQQFRFLPEIGHFAAPEVTEEEEREDPDPDSDILSRRHPYSPKYFKEGGPHPRYGAKVNFVDPEEIFPRYRVNIRAETRTYFEYDAEGNAIPQFEEMVGRLAHFFPPMMAGLRGPYDPDVPPDLRRGEKPVAMLTRQVCETYPELMKTILPDVRDTFLAVSEPLGKALTAEDASAQENWVQAVAEVPGFLTDLPDCHETWIELTDKLTALEAEGVSAQDLRGERITFRRWADAIFRAYPDDRKIELRAAAVAAMLDGLTPESRRHQHTILLKFVAALAVEYENERVKIVRELMEIMTTQVFGAVAAIDCLWGIGWIHGPISNFRFDPRPPVYDALLLSVLGGMNHRDLMITLMRRWAAENAFLGVGTPEIARDREPIAGSERLDMSVLSPEEQSELWALAAWRRDTNEPLSILATALDRLVCAGTRLETSRYTGAVSAFGTLFTQPGSTAVLGGKALMQYPRVRIMIPLAQDADAVSNKAKKALEIVLRVFLPVSLRVEVVWQEAVARLGRSSYLNHDFQRGVRFAESWAALSDATDAENYDRPLL